MLITSCSWSIGYVLGLLPRMLWDVFGNSPRNSSPFGYSHWIEKKEQGATHPGPVTSALSSVPIHDATDILGQIRKMYIIEMKQCCRLCKKKERERERMFKIIVSY